MAQPGAETPAEKAAETATEAAQDNAAAITDTATTAAATAAPANTAAATAPAAQSDGPDPIWKGLLSPHFLAALVFVLIFALLVIKPKSESMADAPDERSAWFHEDPSVRNLFSEKILNDVAQMAPCQLLRKKGASAAFDQAVELRKSDKFNVQNLMCAGNVFVANSDAAVQAQGLDLLQRAVALCPQSKYVRLNYARNLVILSNLKAADNRVEEARKRLEEANSEYAALCDAFPSWVTPRLEQADVFMGLQQPQEAFKRVNEVLRLEPENPAALRLAAVIRADLGAAAKDDGKIKEGFEQYARAFAGERKQKYPQDAKELVEANDGSLDKAIAKAREQAAANKADLGSETLLAELYLFRSQFQEAKDVLLKAKKQDSHNPAVLRLMSEALRGLNDREGAFAEFKNAAALDNEANSK